MFKNYLTVAIRNLLRHRVYSVINISGLAVGMACCILILLLIQDELSYDQFHDNADRIHRVIRANQRAGQVQQSAMTPAILAPMLKQYFPQLAQVVRFMKEKKELVEYGAKRFYEDRFFYADPEVFEVFSFPLLRGDPERALVDPYTVLITDATARKYFGDDDPIGKTLKLNNGSDYRVTGILRNLPPNSHLKFDFLASSQGLKGQQMEAWYMHGSYTYALLPEHTSATEFQRRFPDFVKQHVGPRSGQPSFILQPLRDVYLHSDLIGESGPRGNIQQLYIFAAVSFLILLIACTNFVNLSTALSAHRALEVGTRKVLGALRTQLILQFLGESVLMSMVALALAACLVELLLPGFNTVFGKELSTSYLDAWWVSSAYALVAVSVGVLSGGYTAFVLSSFRPAAVLRGTLKSIHMSSWLRKGLVVFQFGISIVLLICTAVIYSQLEYIRNKNLGFNRERVVVISDARGLSRHYESFRNELLVHPDILMVTSGTTPGGLGGSRIDRYEDEDGLEVSYYRFQVDFDYLKALGMNLLWGRDFSRDFSTDSSAVIVNEAYAGLEGWDSRTFEEDNDKIRSVRDYAGQQRKVVGVVENFHHLSLYQGIEPLSLSLNPGLNHRTVLIRMGPENVLEALDFMKERWKAFVPHRPIVYSFLDESLDRQYRKEQKLGEIFTAFSMLTVFVACMGLFGLASFTAEQRTKEIGVRKVLGASASSVVKLLSKEFTKLVLVANLVAWPVAYYAMDTWLKDFAYRIELNGGMFVLGGILALLIALATVAYQAVKAAFTNPVDALRYE